MSATVLDLLSIVGRLPLSGDQGFVEAARASADGQADLAVGTLRRNLEGLGHVRRSIGPVRCLDVLSPRWCFLPGGTTESCAAVLTGARTGSFLDGLQFLAPTFGLRLDREKLNGGLPDRIVVKGPYQALLNLSSKLRIDVGPAPSTPDAWLLLQRVAPLDARLRECISSTAPCDILYSASSSFFAYNPRTGGFVPWTESAGYSSAVLLFRKAPYDYRLALRLNYNRWRLFLAPLAVDPIWAMWAVRLTSLPHESPLSAPSTWTFRVPAACPLPLSLHQVSCLCSGRTPKTVNGFIEYLEVPPIIQSGIIQRLSLGALLQET